MADKEFRKLSELKGWDKNPRAIRKQDFERLKKQIQELGQYKPLIVTPDGEVLGGNMRLEAYKALGIDDVWVSVVTPKTEAEKVKYALSDNDRAGYYVEEELAELVSQYELDLNLDDFRIDLGNGLSLRELLAQYSPDEVIEDEPPAVEDEAISKTGEVYQLGRHRLMCGDATKIEDVEKLMDGQRADMVFTDPPYGMDYSGRGENTSNKIMGDNIDPTEFYNIGVEIPERYIWGRVENYKHLLIKPRDVIIWKKNNFGMGSGYRGQYECCFYYGNFSGSDSDVWEVNKDGHYEHPTQKPVALAVRAIRNSQPKIVIDYFGGSGSTLIACEQTNRTCYMMELDPKYCDVIRKRYANFIGKGEKWQEITPIVNRNA